MIQTPTHPFKRAHKPESKVLVALSGGLESAVSAALLKSQGHDVVGLSLQLVDPKAAPLDGFSARCCDAAPGAPTPKSIADKLGIPLVVRPAHERFLDRVVDFCVHERLLGREPLPCLECHHEVIFHGLFAAAQELNIPKVATGHYAQVIPDLVHGHVRLARAVDAAIDQSAMLYRLTAAHLEKLLLPIGGIPLSLVNKLAREFGLPPSDGGAGGTACFFSSPKWKEFIAARAAPFFRTPGNIHNVEGEVIGEHGGLYLYRLGDPCPKLPLDDNRGLTVVDFDQKQNSLVVGSAEHLKRRFLHVSKLNWTAPVSGIREIRCQVQMGADASVPAVPAQILAFEGGRCVIELEEVVSTARPGGFVAFYEQNEVIGGGVIERATLDAPAGLYPVVVTAARGEGSQPDAEPA